MYSEPPDSQSVYPVYERIWGFAIHSTNQQLMETIKKILVDTVPVVLGVLIALLISNWNEEKRNEKFLNSVLDSIQKELKEDRDDFKGVLSEQYALIDTIELYVDDDEVSIVDCINKASGFKAVTSKSNSWWSFLNTKIEIVGYETISTLSEIEDRKQFLNLKLSKLMDFVFEDPGSTEYTRKKMLIAQILNLVDTEKRLLSLYEEYLE